MLYRRHRRPGGWWLELYLEGTTPVEIRFEVCGPAPQTHRIPGFMSSDPSMWLSSFCILSTSTRQNYDIICVSSNTYSSVLVSSTHISALMYSYIEYSRIHLNSITHILSHRQLSSVRRVYGTIQNSMVWYLLPLNTHQTNYSSI